VNAPVPLCPAMSSPRGLPEFRTDIPTSSLSIDMTLDALVDLNRQFTRDVAIRWASCLIADMLAAPLGRTALEIGGDAGISPIATGCPKTPTDSPAGGKCALRQPDISKQRCALPGLPTPVTVPPALTCEQME